MCGSHRWKTFGAGTNEHNFDIPKLGYKLPVARYTQVVSPAFMLKQGLLRSLGWGAV